MSLARAWCSTTNCSFPHISGDWPEKAFIICVICVLFAARYPSMRQKTLINAFITSRIDYCNSVFSRVEVTHLRPLQSVLITAARLIVKKSKYDPITATIRDVLHWLPIQKRIQYKLYDLVYKAMHYCSGIFN